MALKNGGVHAFYVHPMLCLHDPIGGLAVRNCACGHRNLFGVCGHALGGCAHDMYVQSFRLPAATYIYGGILSILIREVWSIFIYIPVKI